MCFYSTISEDVHLGWGGYLKTFFDSLVRKALTLEGILKGENGILIKKRKKKRVGFVGRRIEKSILPRI